MRILVAAYYYLPHVGGGTWFVHHVFRRLADLGHEITLLAPRIRVGLSSSETTDDAASKIRLIRLNRTPLPIWFAAFAGVLLLRPRILRVVRSAEVLVAQYHWHQTLPFVTVLLGKLVRRPVVLRVEDWRRWMYGEHPSRRARIEYGLAGPVNKLNEWAAAHADLLLVVNSISERYFADRGIQRAAIRPCGNGIDLEAIWAFPNRTDLRARLGIPQDAKVVVYVGRFSGHEYRVDVLLGAFREVLRNRPDTILILVGDALTVPLRDAQGDLIRQGSLRVTGPIAQVEALAYTALADVAVGPLGPTATTPLKVLEALACGTPVVSGEGSLGSEFAEFASLVDQVAPTPVTVARALLARLHVSRPTVPDELRRILLSFGWNALVSRVEPELRRLVPPTTAGKPETGPPDIRWKGSAGRTDADLPSREGYGIGPRRNH